MVHEKDILEVLVSTDGGYEWWCRPCTEAHARDCGCISSVDESLARGQGCSFCSERQSNRRM